MLFRLGCAVALGRSNGGDLNQDDEINVQRGKRKSPSNMLMTVMIKETHANREVSQEEQIPVVSRS